MQLHIGGNVVISTNNLIGIFNINKKMSKLLRLYLKQNNEISIENNKESAKSFLLCYDENQNSYKIYYSIIASSTLLKRLKIETESEYDYTAFKEEYLKVEEMPDLVYYDDEN